MTYAAAIGHVVSWVQIESGVNMCDDIFVCLRSPGVLVHVNHTSSSQIVDGVAHHRRPLVVATAAHTRRCAGLLWCRICNSVWIDWWSLIGHFSLPFIASCAFALLVRPVTVGWMPVT
jgi:hypothetical protein